jgi:uncharacterized lipoprotein
MILAVMYVGGLAACKTQMETCRKDDEVYAAALEMPPLKAPPDLQAPDTRGALRIPPLAAPERPRGKDEPCLDAPPPFDPKKPVLAPTAPKAEPKKAE